MILPTEPTPLDYIALGLIALYLLPHFGCAVLDFLFYLDDYLENRKKKR